MAGSYPPGNRKETNKMESLTDMRRSQFWQTRTRGTDFDEWEIYTVCADDGQGGDVTNNGAPLKTFEEWMTS